MRQHKRLIEEKPDFKQTHSNNFLTFYNLCIDFLDVFMNDLLCNQAVAFIMMSTQAFHQSVSCFDAFKIIIFMISHNLHSHWYDFLHFPCPIQNLLGLRSCKGTKHEQQSSMVKLVVTISPHQKFLLTWYQ